MGNQARRKQELELWEITNTAKDRNMRQRGRGAASCGRTGHIRTSEKRTPDRRNLPERNMRGQHISAGRSRQGQRNGSLLVNLPERNMRGQHISAGRDARGRCAALPGTPQQNIRRQHETAAGAQNRASKKQRARRRRVRRQHRLAVLMLLALTVGILLAEKSFWQRFDMEVLAQKADERAGRLPDVAATTGMELANPRIQEDFLGISEYNRPGTELSAVNSIFVHYTANPKTSAAQNRSYFENLAQTHERAASAHFIIGYDGEIIQCIPLEEEAYAVIGRNSDSISIECCYISEDGAFTQETYDSLVYLLAMLTERYDLSTQDILRHYDCGGKLCPLYYVEHEDAWQRLLSDVEQYRPET